MLRLRVRRLDVERRDRWADEAFEIRRLPVVDGGRFFEDFLKIFKFSVGNFILFLLFGHWAILQIECFVPAGDFFLLNKWKYAPYFTALENVCLSLVTYVTTLFNRTLWN